MLTVQNDWITYEPEAAVRGAAGADPEPARRVAVRGGAACAERMPAVASLRPRSASIRPRSAPIRPRSASTTLPTRAPRGTETPAAKSVRPAPLRLTRRGRVVLLVMPALLVLSGVLLMLSAPGVAEASTGGPAAATTAPAAAVTRTVVVGTGDSLWTIAERIAPHTDPRVTVELLQRSNHLDGTVLQAGTVLALPAAG